MNAHAQKVSSFRGAMLSAKTNICTFFGTFLAIGFLVSFGLGLLIAPGIYICICYSLSLPIILVEGRSICGSMSRSWELSSGDRWLLFKAFLFFWLSFFIVIFAINLLPAVSLVPKIVIYIFGYTVPIITIKPLLYIFETVLYFDVRARKESYDCVQLLADMQNNRNGVGVTDGVKAAVNYDASVNANVKALTEVNPTADEDALVENQVITDPKQPVWASIV